MQKMYTIRSHGCVASTLELQVTSKAEPLKHLQIGELDSNGALSPGMRAAWICARCSRLQRHCGRLILMQFSSCMDVQIILAAKRIALGNNPYILIILAATLPNQLTQIHLGFKFYAENAGVPIDKNAYDIFDSFLERYGFTITVGTQTGVIIPSAVVELYSSGEGQLVNVQVKEFEDPLLVYFVKFETACLGLQKFLGLSRSQEFRYKSDFLRHRR